MAPPVLSNCNVWLPCHSEHLPCLASLTVTESVLFTSSHAACYLLPVRKLPCSQVGRQHPKHGPTLASLPSLGTSWAVYFKGSLRSKGNAPLLMPYGVVWSPGSAWLRTFWSHSCSALGVPVPPLEPLPFIIARGRESRTASSFLGSQMQGFPPEGQQHSFSQT